MMISSKCTPLEDVTTTTVFVSALEYDVLSADPYGTRQGPKPVRGESDGHENKESRNRRLRMQEAQLA